MLSLLAIRVNGLMALPLGLTTTLTEKMHITVSHYDYIRG